jgi:hypothetical protein
MLVAIGRAFAVDAIDKLLFLATLPDDVLVMSGDGVLQFARLMAAGLTQFGIKANNSWELVTYFVRLTDQGRMLIDAWKSGDRIRLQTTLGGPPEVTDPV